MQGRQQHMHRNKRKFLGYIQGTLIHSKKFHLKQNTQEIFLNEKEKEKNQIILKTAY